MGWKREQKGVRGSDTEEEDEEEEDADERREKEREEEDGGGRDKKKKSTKINFQKAGEIIAAKLRSENRVCTTHLDVIYYLEMLEKASLV